MGTEYLTEALNPASKDNEIKEDNSFCKSCFFLKRYEQWYCDAGMAEDWRKSMLILNCPCCGSEPVIFPATVVWYIGKGCSTDEITTAI